MKTRIIHTKFWEDNFIGTLSPTAKLLFLYLITNHFIGLTGIYECSTRVMAFETGIPQDEIESTLPLFSEKIAIEKGWVILLNAQKYNNYIANDKQKKAYLREYELIPDFIKSKYLPDPLASLENPEPIAKYKKGQHTYLHREIAEKALGRKLYSNEEVHHIDKNPSNNDISNLAIIDKEQHSLLHTGKINIQDTSMILVSDLYDTSHKSEIRNKKSKTITQKSEKGVEEYNAFIQGFNEIVGSSYKGTKADKEHFHARILDGYTLGSLLSATRKASQDKYLMGENDRHRRYLTPEYILRPNKLEDWLNQPESNEDERKSIFKDFIDLVNECGKKDFKGSDIAMQQLFNDLDKGFTFAQIGRVVQLAAKDNWVRSANQQRIDLYTPEYLTRQTTLERFLNSKKGGER